MTKSLKSLALLIVVLAMLTACGNALPVDPHGSLDRIRHGELRVGVSQNEPWVQLHDDGDPTGTEVDLVIEFAKSLGSEVHWISGSEEALMESMNQGEIDLLASGLTSKTPWTDKAAITRPYREWDNTWGETEKHVLAVPMGENALLSELEAFLDRSRAGE